MLFIGLGTVVHVNASHVSMHLAKPQPQVPFHHHFSTLRCISSSSGFPCSVSLSHSTTPSCGIGLKLTPFSLMMATQLQVSEGAPSEQDSGSSPSLPIGEHDLLIVGPGVLGRLVAEQWRKVLFYISGLDMYLLIDDFQFSSMLVFVHGLGLVLCCLIHKIICVFTHLFKILVCLAPNMASWSP